MLLKKGDSGAEVVELQEKLVWLGYDIGGTVTGYFGSLTKAAVQRFQRDHGLTDDGIVGDGTWGVMQTAKPVLKLNGFANHAEYVTLLQNRLCVLGYSCAVDGIFSQATHDAAVAFQSRNGLTADGIVGFGTWNELYDSGAVVNDGYLRRGSSGEAVTKLQNRLNELGYNCGTPDGAFGPATQNAVAKFQADNGLVADGIVGPSTFDALYGSHRTLKMGSTGSAVTQLQDRLNELGYVMGTADGEFGTNTYNAVKDFQRNNGLIADGIVGPKTWAELFSTNANGPSTISTVILQIGSRGAYVVWLQNRLLALDYYLGHAGADGVFGDATKNAVMEFQENNNLTADGIVGEMTWERLHATNGTSNSIDSWGNVFIRKGRRGDDVELIQQRLIALGYNCGNAGADGIFGASTYNAVLEFQRRNNLQQDGIVGQLTYTALFSDEAISADYSDSQTGIIKFGSRGEEVTTIQRRLIALGYYLGKFGADGVFGDITYNAVKLFQRYNDLSADGIVGPLTYEKLMSDDAVTYADGKAGLGGGYDGPTYNFSGDVLAAINHMISVATAEVGYREKKYYSKYGAWYGEPHAYWCNCFVSWCANKADIVDKLIPSAAYTETSCRWFVRKNAFQFRASGYTPHKGDCIYFKLRTDPLRTVTHIGLVREDSDGTVVKTIEGNLTYPADDTYSEVRLCQYSLDDTDIVGYGDIYAVAAGLDLDVPVQYCGGENYHDVSFHNMVLKSGGYMECSICGYSVDCCGGEHYLDATYHNMEMKSNGDMVCSICGYSVRCCGWANNYKNVVEHDLVLQSNRYYVCKDCGYKVISPALQDRDILSDLDYQKVVALSHASTHYESLRAGDHPLFFEIEPEEDNGTQFYYMPEKCMRKIDSIRSQEVYRASYDYRGSDGNYLPEYAGGYTVLENNECKDIIFISSDNVNSFNLGLYNGAYEELINIALGIFASATSPIFMAAAAAIAAILEADAATFMQSCIDIIIEKGVVVATRVKYLELLSKAIDLYNLADATEFGIVVGDGVVQIKPMYHTELLNFIFDSNNDYKFCMSEITGDQEE